VELKKLKEELTTETKNFKKSIDDVKETQKKDKEELTKE